MVYEAGGFDAGRLKDPRARAVVDETMRTLSKAIEEAVPHDVPQTLRNALEENAFIFSGFKTFHSLREVGLSMLDEKGDVKPLEAFRKDVQAINAKYNTNYLRAEYQHALGSSLMAVKWQQLARNTDRYFLQYRTAEDEKVRESHTLLNGITLPADDPFWDKYYPPNGWGCRCQTVQVRRSKYPQSDAAQAMKQGDAATEEAKQKMFRFNTGKTMRLFSKQHPYFKVPQNDKEFIRRNALYQYYKQNSNYKDVEFDDKTGGLKAAHIDHNFDKVGGVYEIHVQNAGYKAGNIVILEAERGKADNERCTEGTWNGLRFEVAGRESGTENNVLRGLKHCAAKRSTQIAVLFYQKNNFSKTILEKALKRYKGLEKLNDGQFLRFEKIICVQGEQIVYQMNF